MHAPLGIKPAHSSVSCPLELYCAHNGHEVYKTTIKHLILDTKVLQFNPETSVSFFTTVNDKKEYSRYKGFREPYPFVFIKTNLRFVISLSNNGVVSDSGREINVRFRSSWLWYLSKFGAPIFVGRAVLRLPSIVW